LKNDIEVSDLLVTQVGLRDKGQIPNMTRFLRTGGTFNEETLGSYAILHGSDRVSPLIEIARFEDGVMAVHNGHHRVISAFLARHNKRIYSDEFFIREWKYQDYDDIVLPYWVTPFKVTEEVRFADLAPWKLIIKQFYREHGESRTIEFIRDNKHQYSVKRFFFTVGDMVSRLGLYNLKG
jgi:hypothetical protein